MFVLISSFCNYTLSYHGIKHNTYNGKLMDGKTEYGHRYKKIMLIH